MKTYRMDEIVEISSSKRIKLSEYVSSGVPFFRSKEIINLNQHKKINFSTKRNSFIYLKIVLVILFIIAVNILVNSTGTI